MDAVYTLVEGRSSNETVAITSNARTVMLEILQGMLQAQSTRWTASANKYVAV